MSCSDDPLRVDEGAPTQVFQALQLLVGVTAQKMQRHQPWPLPRPQRLALNHALASCSGISSGQHSRTTERTVRSDDLEPHACVLLRHFQWSAQLDNRKDSDLNHTLASWSGFSSGQHRRTTEKSVRCDDLEPHVCILLRHLQWTTVRTMGSDGPRVLFRYLQWSAQRNSRKDSEER